MKSAYELAMERLAENSGPPKSLTDEQRERIAEIDRKFDARAAEEKLGAETRAATAPYDEAAKIREGLAAALASLEDQRERDKQQVWDESAG